MLVKRIVAAGVIFGAGLVGTAAAPTQAGVSGCSYYSVTETNTAYAQCASGDSEYWVGATCVTAAQPYLKPVTGVRRSPGGEPSSISGASLGCHALTNVWIGFR
ncbi:hypothetical protein [Spongiactinospora sp. TRM90649]|uniref:hypothetical protein n=1 Tax=Spongiactinospora sp. TRM90649 TaxID=3031114 RepID=UPI0023F6DAC7|nr:hypothetical protein [Spongiactinospora sp. TRM90649]MDF5758168.1 hypothetical protein [Spongiactinospora sp. TRM90649]